MNAEALYLVCVASLVMWWPVGSFLGLWLAAREEERASTLLPKLFAVLIPFGFISVAYGWVGLYRLGLGWYGFFGILGVPVKVLLIVYCFRLFRMLRAKLRRRGLD